MHSFNEYREIINTHLTDLIADPGEQASELAEAMKYSLEVGGKRLRPALRVSSPAGTSKKLFRMLLRWNIFIRIL